ncbi:MAG TPA: hypothetical protein VES67_06390 [Vicinamibacterales bacterium]|nr:hypothetical protein [Vicinamibacterales bacterium]
MVRVFMTIALVSGATLAAAQQPTPEQMKAMLEQMKPGLEHQPLATLVGKWTMDVVYRMGDGPTMKAQGVRPDLKLVEIVHRRVK